MNYLILADDFTGAMDSCVKLLPLRRPARVYLRYDSPGTSKQDAVISIDTDTRHLEPHDAYRRVCDLCVNIRETSSSSRDGDVIYKKIDSTMRGNIGAEMDGVMDGFGYRLACIAPSFPEKERTVVNGVSRVGDLPLSESPSGRDPLSPVFSSDVAEIVEAQSRRPIGNLRLSAIRASADQAESDVRSLIDSGIECIVADAETDDDLAVVVRVMRRVSEDVLFVGSAGLAAALAAATSSAPKSAPFVAATFALGPRQTLVVNGSLMPVARAQVDVLRGRCDGVAVVRFIGTEILTRPDATMESLLSEMETSFKDRKICVLAADPTNRIDLSSENPTAASHDIARFLGSVVERYLRKHDVATIVLTGGSTAKSILDAIGVTVIDVHDELEAGIVYGSSLNGAKTYGIVTKAGGFGDEETLLRICCKNGNTFENERI